MSDNVIPLHPASAGDANHDAGLKEGPHMDAQTERAFLGALLMSHGGTVYQAVSEFLCEQHFAYEVHGRIYSAICGLYAAKQPVDSVIVANALGDEPLLVMHGGTRVYIGRLPADAVGPATAQSYARQIVNDAALRTIIADAEATLKSARAAGAKADDVVGKLKTDLANHVALGPGLDEWDASLDLGPIPPRGWLLGTVFCRRFVSSLIADGAVGKTATRLAQCLSAATGRSLTGEHVFQRCRVLIISLEDDRDELRRRLKAAMIHHGVTDDEVRGWLFLAAPGRDAGKLAIMTGGRAVVGPLLAKLVATIKRRNIDIVCIDPFVKCHGVEENSNDALDFVVGLLTQTAIDHDCAVDVPHHVSKGPTDPGNANRGRGAGAFKDGGRLVYTLSPMSEDEAKLFNVSTQERKSLVRMDSGKVNLVPAAAEAIWFQLIGVPIGNGNALYPNGDEVQTVAPWTPPDVWVHLPPALANEILDRIDAGFADGRRYSPAPQAKERAAWPLVIDAAPSLNETQGKQVINTWVKNTVLLKQPYRDPQERRDVEGLFVNPAKRPGARFG